MIMLLVNKKHLAGYAWAGLLEMITSPKITIIKEGHIGGTDITIV